MFDSVKKKLDIMAQRHNDTETQRHKGAGVFERPGQTMDDL